MDPAAGRPLASLVLKLARGLNRLRISPNVLTIVGFSGTVASALVLALGYPIPAALLFLAASGLDMLDGTLARLQNKTTPFGALLDSTLDRYGEAVFLVALAYQRGNQGGLDLSQFMLLMATLAGSILVSYVRARAEGLGLSGKTGWFQRPERVILLAAAVAIAPLTVALLAILAVGTHLTVAQRILDIWRQTKRN